jgi:hypothetical protein
MSTFLYPPVSVTTLPPLGGATSANQLLEITELQDINTELNTQTTRLNLLATEAKQDTQITRLNLLSTEAKQDTQITRLNLLSTEASLLNAITELQSLKSNTAQKQLRDGIFSDYGGTPISNAGWTQILASTSAIIKSLTVFESSGFPIELAVGGPGSEVKILNIPPGGLNGEIPLSVAAGQRLSLRSLTADASNAAGTYIIMNLLG